MDGFFTTLTLSFSPQIFFSILGGAIGAYISSDRKRYGWQLSFMFMLAAIMFSAAMGEYFYLTRGYRFNLSTRYIKHPIRYDSRKYT